MLAVLAPLAAALSAALKPAAAQDCAANPNTYSFNIGPNPAKILYDGTLPFPAAFAFIDDPSVSARVVQDYFINPANVSAAINVMYLEMGGEKCLFDTGNGEAAGGALNAELAANGIDRADITSIFLSHGHPDHLGGLVLADGSLAFPNAKVYVSETEWEYWRADEVDTLTSQMPADFLAASIDTAKAVFAAVEDHVELFELGGAVVPGIESIATPWHTPGHAAFKITFGNGTLVYTGDAVISYVSAEHPWLQVRFDVQPELGPAGRYAFLDDVAALGAAVNMYHTPFPGFGNVRRVSGAAFRWVDRPYAGSPGVVAQCPAPQGGYGAGGDFGYGYGSQ